MDAALVGQPWMLHWWVSHGCCTGGSALDAGLVGQHKMLQPWSGTMIPILNGSWEPEDGKGTCTSTIPEGRATMHSGVHVP